MKFSTLLLSMMAISAALSVRFEQAHPMRTARKTRKLTAVPGNRKLEQNLTSSYLLGGAPDAMNTSHIQMLINQQKGMENFKKFNIWLADLESRLDDMRDSINRRVNDVAIGMQRRNMLIAHYNYMGEATGNSLGGIGRMNPIAAH